MNGNPAMKNHIKELQKQQIKYQDEVIVIHLKPIYILLFLIFGLLLGYLIPLNKVALTVILIAISSAWQHIMNVLESFLGYEYSSTFIITKIGFLLVLNLILLRLAIIAFQRT